MKTTENPLTAAYRAEKHAERHHRRCWLWATGANPTEEDFADYRAACRGLDAARAFSAKLDAELNGRASF